MAMTYTVRDTRTAIAEPSRTKLSNALWIGASLQFAAVLLPLIDLWFIGSIKGHVRDTYPQWGTELIDGDTRAIAFALVGIGLLGVVGWIGTALYAARGRKVRAAVTTMFVLGMGTLLIVATMGGGDYDVIVPPWIGVILVCLPLWPAISALVHAWRLQR